MAVRLLFPSFIFERQLLSPELGENGFNQDYLDLLKRTMDEMRRSDPQGRQVSNAYTGWQSNDGCESSPAFKKAMRCIIQTFYDEVFPFHGLSRKDYEVKIGNSWANINDPKAWNKPHLHNGCWYSGVLYIHAEGDEGDIVFIDKDPKVVSVHPGSPRTPESVNYSPTAGQLILFPSALMHMVEPNFTDRDRYSISFNIEMFQERGGRQHGDFEHWNPREFVFDLDAQGTPIYPK